MAPLSPHRTGRPTADLTVLARDSVLHASSRISVAIIVEILFLMSVKPALPGILWSLLAAAGIGTIAIWPLFTRGATAAGPPDRAGGVRKREPVTRALSLLPIWTDCDRIARYQAGAHPGRSRFARVAIATRRSGCRSLARVPSENGCAFPRRAPSRRRTHRVPGLHGPCFPERRHVEHLDQPFGSGDQT